MVKRVTSSNPSSFFSIYTLCIWAFGLRLALILYGELQDKYFRLKYTDIDYSVFSDAAKHVTQGESPFQRDTYRYTPLIAYLLVPNHLVHPMFGKVLFSLLDCLAGYMMYLILRTRSVDIATAMICSCFWLFNPLPLVVSSRGNAESLLACLILACLLLLMRKQTVMAAIVFGLAVHVKTYPIIYAPSIYLLLNWQANDRARRKPKGRLDKWTVLLTPTEDSILFAVVSIGVLSSCTALFFHWYGEEFMEETLWYHLKRKDLQHNFSIYFYIMRMAETAGGYLPMIVSLGAFIPQLLSTVVLSFRYYWDLPFVWFFTTAMFVTFNKVCTSQYFLWYLCLLPLIVPMMKMSKMEVGVLGFLWLSAQGIWFTPAYHYEYRKADILVYVWFASLYFFWINILCLWRIALHHVPSPVFDPTTLKLRPLTIQWTALSGHTRKVKKP